MSCRCSCWSLSIEFVYITSLPCLLPGHQVWNPSKNRSGCQSGSLPKHRGKTSRDRSRRNIACNTCSNPELTSEMSIRTLKPIHRKKQVSRGMHENCPNPTVAIGNNHTARGSLIVAGTDPDNLDLDKSDTFMVPGWKGGQAIGQVAISFTFGCGYSWSYHTIAG